jgi:serine/threonine protein kinase/tetratricopeptide (TPR) repeat protein
MSAIDSERLVELFSQAIELPVEERLSFCDHACGGEVELRRRLGELLSAHALSGSFMNDAPTSPRSKRETIHLSIPEIQPLREGPGSVIGRYKLLQQIGQGGCGTVFMAEQDQPFRRRVALKVIKLGMDTASVIGRFEAERQALAMMDHPNIAKVLDAGATESGRPYFVMELVRGIPINQFCDENQLDTRKRLELFVQVCQAIQHAHNKGIIHRDIKPSNILVTLTDGEPTPKVIDFGIAKATQGPLTERTVFTAFDQFIGTPAYMSPEQAQMSSIDVDSQSDIYSLGVLLYELLTGRTPFDASELAKVGIDAIRQTIREVEPPRPSSRLSTLQGDALTTTAKARRTEGMRLLAIIRGDLDWIVMKCLEKNRTRRYETASALASDIGNHLADRTVVARPPSIWYQMGKTFSRNRVAFIATGAVLLAIVVGLIVSLSLMVRAMASERQARMSERQKVRLSDFLRDMLEGPNPSIAQGREDPVLHDILSAASNRVFVSLAAEPETMAEVSRTLGRTYRALGEFGTAESFHRMVLTTLRSLGKEESREGTWARYDMALALADQRRWKEAETLYLEAIQLTKNLHLHTEGAIAKRDLSFVYLCTGRADRAEALAMDAIQSLKSLLGENDSETLAAESRLAEIQYELGKHQEGLRTARRVLDSQRRVGGMDKPLTLRTLFILGVILETQGSFQEAERAMQECVDRRSRVLGELHPTTLSTMDNLAVVLSYQGKFARAENIERFVADHFARNPGSNHPNAIAARFNLAEYLRNQNKTTEAEQMILEVLKSSEQLPAAEDVDLIEKRAGLVILYQFTRRHPEAEKLARTMIEGTTALSSNPADLARVMGLLSVSLLAGEKFSEAEIMARKELAIHLETNPGSWNRYSAEGRLGLSLLGLKQTAEAENRLATAYRELVAREATIPAIDKVRIAEVLKGWMDARIALNKALDPQLAAELKARWARAAVHDRIDP